MEPFKEPLERKLVDDVYKELLQPNLDGYEFFAECNKVMVYRKYHEDSGLYEYKVYGVVEDITPEESIEVYLDTEYRLEWDSYAIDLYEFRDGLNSGMYWQVKYPFPLSNRDYTYKRIYEEVDVNGIHIHVVISYGEVFPSEPPRPGVVRVNEYKQYVGYTSWQENGRTGTKAFFQTYENPGGMLPVWLINWAAKFGLPNYISTANKAIMQYKSYKERKLKQ